MNIHFIICKYIFKKNLKYAHACVFIYIHTHIMLTKTFILDGINCLTALIYTYTHTMMTLKQERELMCTSA